MLPGPWGVVVSTLLLLGVWGVGYLALGMIFSNKGLAWPALRYQSGLVGALILAAVVFPLALIGCFDRITAGLFALLLVAVGLMSTPLIVRSARTWIAEWESRFIPRPLTFCCLAMLGGYFLLALGPITDADALDYHVGVALQTLNTGAHPADPAWFHSRLAGAGEALIAVGLSIGAEQFGALLQWMGLFSVTTMMLTCCCTATSQETKKLPDYRGWIILLLLSTPVFLAWISSPKPMILPGAMTSLALYLSYVVIARSSDSSVKDPQLYCILIFGLSTVASNMKFSFTLTAGIIIVATLYWQWKNNRLGKTILTLVGCLIILYFPFAAWKWNHFGGGVIEILTSPLPGNWPGTQQFEAYLRGYRDSTFPFPLSLVIPSSLGNITTVLGIGLPILIVSMLIRRAWDAPLIRIALLSAVLGALLGQANARFFLEPFYWGLMGLMTSGLLSARGYNTFIAAKAMISLQAVVVAAAIVFGIVTISVGSISDTLRGRVMHSVANDHITMRWVDKNLPSNAIVITDLRSMGLVPRQAYPTDWRAYLSPADPNRFFYLSRINSDIETIYLLTNNKESTSIPTECIGHPYAGPFKAEIATRNPWNKIVVTETSIYELRRNCFSSKH